MAQTLPPIKAVHDLSVTQIFIRPYATLFLPHNADYPIFNEKNEIGVV